MSRDLLEIFSASDGTGNTGAIECVVDTPSGPLLVYSLHLTPVSCRERLMQLDRLSEFILHYPGPAKSGKLSTTLN